MTLQTKHHPTFDQLRQFNEGTLSIGLSVAISAHLDFCAACQTESNRLTSNLAQDWVDDVELVPLSQVDNFSHFLDDITRQPQLTEADRVEVRGDDNTELHMHERSVRLPAVLAKVAGKGVVWRRLSGGINTAGLGIDRETQCDFMYMKPGSQAPRHKHRGLEVTLVLDGTFFDELGEYGPGDFVLRRGSETHTPQSEEGCLCYSVLDSPLTFTSGLSRLINPFQRYLFNKQLQQSSQS